MLPTIKATLHSKPPDKDGRRLVIIRVTFQRKVFNKSTQLKATEKEFDGLFKPSAENSAYKNNILKKQIARYEQEFLRLWPPFRGSPNPCAALVPAMRLRVLRVLFRLVVLLLAFFRYFSACFPLYFLTDVKIVTMSKLPTTLLQLL